MGRPTPTRPQKPRPKAVMAALLKVEDLLWNAEQSVAEANEVAFAHRELINEHIRGSLVLRPSTAPGWQLGSSARLPTPFSES